MSKITTVAVVGCGRIANSAHFPALTQLDNVRIKYACDLILEKAEAVKEKYAAVEKEMYRLEHTGLAPSEELNSFLEAKGTAAVLNGSSLADLIRRPQISYAALGEFDKERPALPKAVWEQAEIRIKYEGYIRRQMKQVEEFTRLEKRLLPENMDYSGVIGLRLEAREKLGQIRPRSFGQASRISGVSPADVTALMIYLER